MNILRKLSIELTVFGCGAVVMIYEIIGSRIIAPYIGTSTYTWTSLIGVILAALSLGYWLGGRAADKNPDRRILAGVVFFSGGLVAVTVLIKDPLLALISGTNLPLELSAVVAALLLFAPAAVLLGFVTPYAVRLTVEDVEHSGRAVGRIYALSTIGSIAGTFCAGFLLIPFVGSTRTLYLLAAILFILSVLLAAFEITRARIALLVLFVFAVAGTETKDYLLESRFNYFDFDTAYSRVQVFETTKNKRPIRALAIDPFIYQTSMYLDTGEPGAAYIRFYHLVSDIRPEFRRSLLIGGAGYGFAKEYLSKYPVAKLDVVEIDPGMTALARRFFDLKDDPRLRIIHEDGRIFLNSAPAGQYDAVFVDAFTSLFSVPFQLTTIEAVEKIKQSLGSEGVVFVNIGSALEGPGSAFLHAEAATYQKVFSEVRFLKVEKDKDANLMQNVVLVASMGPLRFSKKNDGIKGHVFDLKNPTGEVLTDDLAPVERFISIAQNRYTSNAKNQ